MLFVKRLRELLAYDAETGVFRWRRRKNKIAGGVKAVSKHRKYRYIRVDGVDYLAHRLAWFYVYGAWPDDVIDHINRDSLDNRLINLRDVTRSVNNHNCAVRSHSRSGFKGVALAGDKYMALLSATRRQRYLGTFDTAEEAHRAYLRAAADHYGAQEQQK